MTQEIENRSPPTETVNGVDCEQQTPQQADLSQTSLKRESNISEEIWGDDSPDDTPDAGEEDVVVPDDLKEIILNTCLRNMPKSLIEFMLSTKFQRSENDRHNG